ncbi:MAG: hypothetical protein KDE59_02240 [Anaerolineales bacterium]|nr:hypothetical protein [Anaerolineales bacterium]
MAPISTKIDDEVLNIGGRQITLRRQTVSGVWRPAGFVYQRPRAILVSDATGEQLIPIPDVTRQLQLTFLGLAALFSLLTALSGPFSRKTN